MDSDELAELRALLAAQSAQISALVSALRPASQSSLTVRELYRQYEIAQKHRPGWRTAAHMVSPFVAMHGERDATGLLVADWTAYRVSRDDLAPSSLNYTLRVVKAMLRWAKAEGLLTAAPQLCDAKKQKAKKHRETAPTEDDVGRILAEAEGARDRVIILCACDSGMRNSEIRHLQWHWIDRVAMQIHLPAAITKSRKARSVPMTERLLAAIDAIPRDIRSPFVLRSPRTNGPYSQPHMTVMWQELARRAGLRPADGEGRVRLHDGRHGFATNAAERGIRIEVISEILGHATLEQTREYVQPRKGDLEEARKRFEAGIKRETR